MARGGALLLIFASVVVLQRVAAAEAGGLLRTGALALGFSLIAATLLGTAVARLRLPRLSGYLIFGLICGPYLLNLITGAMARELQLVNGVAISLIAFVAGLELNVTDLRPQLRAIVTVGFVSILGAVVILTGVLWAAWPWLPIAPPDGALATLAASLITAALVVSFSPTVTIAVIAESRARGPLTELVLAVVVVADLILILLFAFAMQAARWSIAGSPLDVNLLVELAWEIIGSLAFGAILGAVFALYLRLFAREVTLMLLALCGTLAIVAPILHFELILASLAAGLVVENVAPPEGEQLKEAVERGALPVLVVFFAAAGASLQLDVLALIGWTALALAAIRLAFIWVVAGAGVRLAGLAHHPTRLVWMGLISQAGVTLGLATLVAVEFPTWGVQVQTLVVALTGLHVLVGPILFKAALARAREIGRLDEEAVSGPAAAS